MAKKKAAKKSSKKSAKKTAKKSAKKSTRRKVSSRRELIDTGVDKRYVRHSKGGQFKEGDDVGLSLSRDRRSKAKTKAKKGHGDRGD